MEMRPKYTHLSVRVSDELMEELKDCARKTERSTGGFVRAALRETLREWRRVPRADDIGH
jgi:predicted transcriptional regulator